MAFDWRKNLSPVKEQGLCASCWAFASTTVMEAYISIQLKKMPVSLSPQAMVDCDVDLSCVIEFMSHWKALHGMTQGGAQTYTHVLVAGGATEATAHSTPCSGLQTPACPLRRTTRLHSRPPLDFATLECQR